MTLARGPRTPYEAAPGPVRAWVERELGSQVVAASTQYGGFSPGVAARLVTSSGRRAFVKAVGAELNPDSPVLFRQEVDALARIDRLGLTQAPRLYSTYDDGAWVALLVEDIEGRTAEHPWQADDAARVLEAVDELTEALTPSPWPDAPYAAERSASFLSGWDRVVADGIDLPDWLRDRGDELIELARYGRQAVLGESLAHWDLRADNLLLTDDRVVFVDWAWAARAAPWADRVLIRSDIRFGGGDAVALTDLPPDDEVTGFIAAFLGGLWWAQHQPPPPGLPTIRTFQRAFAASTLNWLRSRMT